MSTIKANYQKLSDVQQEFKSFSKAYPTIAQMLPGLVFFEQRNAVRIKLLQEKLEPIRARFCAKNDKGEYFFNEQKKIVLLDESTREEYEAQASAISKTASEALGLKPGDGIAIFQDIENPTDWYACKDKDGFPLRDHSSGGLVFNASAVANHLFDSIQFNLKRFNFPIAKEGVKADKLIVHAIMTSAATKSES